MKKLGLICSFIILTHTLFAQFEVTADPVALTPGTTTNVTFTFDNPTYGSCDFDGTVIPSTTAPGVTFSGLVPIPPNMVAVVTDGVCSFNVILAAGASTDFVVTLTVLSNPANDDCVDGSAQAVFGVAPPNNDCAGAINLGITQDMCIASAYSTTNSTASSASPPCGFASYHDLFYKFTANNTVVNVEFPSLPGTVGHVGLYTACGASPTYCIIQVSSSQEQFTGLNVGTEYILQLTFLPGGSGTDQEVCLWSETTVPVTWLNPLTVRSVNEKAEITFSTAQQTNNSHFEIEHSRDGQTFTVIGEVKGEANSTLETEYKYIHDNPAEGINYYRVKQVDIDGKFSYGNLASMICNKGKARAYPNPVDNVLTVSSKYDGNLVIYNNVWQEVGTYALTKGQIDINMSPLETGIYFLKFSDGNVERIVKN